MSSPEAIPTVRLDPASVVDRARYPVDDLASETAQRVLAAARAQRADRGVAILPGFVRTEVIEALSREADALVGGAYLEDVWGTPYLELPQEDFPAGHPRRTAVHSLTWVIAYDQIPAASAARALYQWDAFRDFVAAVLERPVIHRMADPLGALNLTVMQEGHVQGWHYDNADFVVSLAIAASEAGGDFECAARIRDEDDERYPDVQRVLAGEGDDLLEVLPMTPGTLMIFEGRQSLHRVSPVRGARPRVVALFAYDVRPGLDSSELFKLVRYGRSEPLA